MFNIIGRIKKVKRELDIKQFKEKVLSSENSEITGRYYDKGEVICSMTTIPERLPILHHSILSILHQTIRPNKVVVYLGVELFKEHQLTKELEELERYGVEYRFVSDVRVHTKYYYAFQEFRDKYVMTFDDDQLYRKDLLENLLKMSEIYNQHVICARAHGIQGSVDGNYSAYSNWSWETYKKGPTHVVLPTGVGGVLYRPNIFSEKLFEKELFLKLSPNADDLWLKAVELYSGIPTVMVPLKLSSVNVDNSQQISLQSINVHQNRNDEYWMNLTEYFGINYQQLLLMEEKLKEGVL